MAEYEYTDEIICPYCDHKFSDSWEYGDDDYEIDCVSCGKEFELNTHTTIKYSTKRKDCEDGQHVWSEGEPRIIDQKTCDRWNAEGFSGRHNHKPENLWKRTCSNCDDYEYKRTEIGEPDPWRTNNV